MRSSGLSGVASEVSRRLQPWSHELCRQADSFWPCLKRKVSFSGGRGPDLTRKISGRVGSRHDPARVGSFYFSPRSAAQEPVLFHWYQTCQWLSGAEWAEWAVSSTRTELSQRSTGPCTCYSALSDIAPLRWMPLWHVARHCHIFHVALKFMIKAPVCQVKGSLAQLAQSFPRKEANCLMKMQACMSFFMRTLKSHAILKEFLKQCNKLKHSEVYWFRVSCRSNPNPTREPAALGQAVLRPGRFQFGPAQPEPQKIGSCPPLVSFALKWMRFPAIPFCRHSTGILKQLDLVFTWRARGFLALIQTTVVLLGHDCNKV